MCIYIDMIYLGIVTHNFFEHLYQELWPLIYAEISFPLNILVSTWHIFTKFYIWIHIDKI